MTDFENMRFQTLQSLYFLLFIFIVKLKQFEIPLSVKVSSIFYLRLYSLIRVCSKFTFKIEKMKIEFKICNAN